MTKVLVTGGTGFIGRHLVARLRERGEQVRCLARRVGAVPVGVEAVPGDLTDSGSLGPAVRGVDVVYHVGGATLAVQAHDFQRVNTDGTRALAETCARQPNPPVFLYVSSLAAAGPTRLDCPLTEEAVARPISAYGRSKLAAERHLRDLAGQLPSTIVRPPAVFGPGDHYTVKIFRMARRGLAMVPGRMPIQLSWIYVADLVDALLGAAERGQRLDPAAEGARGIYYAALEEYLEVVEAARLIAEVQGRRRLRALHLPGVLCRAAAAVNEFRGRLMGHAYWVNPDKLREALAGSWTCSSAKAKAELGFVCRTPLAEGFRLSLQWYVEQGWL